ncbi:MAG TPA: alpha-amylase family protein [Acetobacteraceae bacterium]|nr:alpha-amylase family protein [Acetobacteraceae bacterium]
MRWVLTAWLIAAAGILNVSVAAADPWPKYQIIEWQPRNPAQLATLKRIGVDAAAVIADRDGTGTPLPMQTAPLIQAGFHWYIENAATDFYSAYHRWTPGKPGNWRFIELQKRYRADPNDLTALMRDPSLSDPVWQAHIDARLTAIVHQEQRFHPLFYSLGDETGIADLSAFWDFDFSRESLAGMRAWLRRQYPSLAALNAEWGTDFRDWGAVRPETTIQAMHRTDGNFAAWADFKTWMDVAFAAALRRGTDAVHAADPHALAVIEGAQMPGWGGYDYTRLARAVDVMEIYDMGDSLPIARSFNPRLIALTTSFGARPSDIHAIWRELLRGTRGLVLWDDNNSIVQPEGTLGQRGKVYAALFAELHRIAPLLIAATPHEDPVAILYSPASFRTQWMLDQQPKGDAWIERGAATELEDDAFRTALRGYVTSLSQLGLQPHFVSAAMLPALRDKALILPDTLALSPADAKAIAGFAARGGVVIADRQPGWYDAHSRRLPQPALPPGIARLVAPDDRTALSALLSQAGVAAPIRFTAPQMDVEMHTFAAGTRTIVALQRSSPGEGNEAVELTLPQRMLVTDLRRGVALGRWQKLTVTLGPIEPAILQIAP